MDGKDDAKKAEKESCRGFKARVALAKLRSGAKFAHAFLNAIAVLIIACPCAIGLAMSISMTVAMGQGARTEILFRNAESIERMRDIDTVIVDKTGTLRHPQDQSQHCLRRSERRRQGDQR